VTGSKRILAILAFVVTGAAGMAVTAAPSAADHVHLEIIADVHPDAERPPGGGGGFPPCPPPPQQCN